MLSGDLRRNAVNGRGKANRIRIAHLIERRVEYGYITRFLGWHSKMAGEEVQIMGARSKHALSLDIQRFETLLYCLLRKP